MIGLEPSIPGDKLSTFFRHYKSFPSPFKQRDSGLVTLKQESDAMGTKYRVDVSQSPSIVPVGMNSLKYLGDNWDKACGAFFVTPPGINAWNRPDESYGVILSIWDESKRDYVVKKQKGF
jgi:hypothetical protein